MGNQRCKQNNRVIHLSSQCLLAYISRLVPILWCCDCLWLNRNNHNKLRYWRSKAHPSIRLSEYFFLRELEAVRGFGMKDPNKVLFGITHILWLLDSRVLWFFFFEIASKPGESRQQHNPKHLGKNFLESFIVCKQNEKNQNQNRYQSHNLQKTFKYLLACQIAKDCRKSGKVFACTLTVAILNK